MSAMKICDRICICIVNLRMTSEMGHLPCEILLLISTHSRAALIYVCIEDLMDNLHTPPLIISFLFINKVKCLKIHVCLFDKID